MSIFNKKIRSSCSTGHGSFYRYYTSSWMFSLHSFYVIVQFFTVWYPRIVVFSINRNTLPNVTLELYVCIYIISFYVQSNIGVVYKVRSHCSSSKLRITIYTSIVKIRSSSITSTIPLVWSLNNAICRLIIILRFSTLLLVAFRLIFSLLSGL
jgi:hypothetical protein